MVTYSFLQLGEAADFVFVRLSVTWLAGDPNCALRGLELSPEGITLEVVYYFHRK